MSVHTFVVLLRRNRPRRGERGEFIRNESMRGPAGAYGRPSALNPCSMYQDHCSDRNALFHNRPDGESVNDPMACGRPARIDGFEFNLAKRGLAEPGAIPATSDGFPLIPINWQAFFRFPTSRPLDCLRRLKSFIGSWIFRSTEGYLFRIFNPEGSGLFPKGHDFGRVPDLVRPPENFAQRLTKIGGGNQERSGTPAQ